MVVSVLIITCFLKLAACNPYLSSNVKFPPVASFPTTPSQGNTNQVPNLQRNNGYIYSIPQQMTQKVEPSNINKAASMPLPIIPEQYLSDKNIQNNVDGTNSISEFKTNKDQAPNLVPLKIINDAPSSKGQRKSFSKTFDNFRENVLKNMNLGLKSKSPQTNGLDNIKAVDAGSIYQTPTAIEPKTPLPQFLQQKDNLGQQTVARNNEDLKPFDSTKDHTTNAENNLGNGMQVSRLQYNNGNPLIQISKENSFGKLNPNIQQQDVTYNSANVFKNDIGKMQPSRVPPYMPKEGSLIASMPVPVNQNLQPPYKEERNVPQALRPPDQLNSLNLLSLNIQSMLDNNQTIKDNRVKSNASSSPQLQISRTPYNNNLNQPYSTVISQLVTPGNNSLPENKLQKVDLRYNGAVPQILNILPDAQEFSSGLSSPEVQTAQKLLNKEKNATQTFRVPNYNNFNRPYTVPFRDQSIPVNQLTKEIQSYKTDSNYNDVEKNNVYTYNNQKEISSEGVIPETIVQTTQSLHSKEGSEYQTFKAPYNNRFNRPYTRPFNQQVLSENKLLKENQTETFDPVYDVRNVDSELGMHNNQQEATLSVATPEAIIQPAKNPQIKQGNESQTYLPPYYNNFYRSKPLSQQLISENQLIIEHPSGITDPNYIEVITMPYSPPETHSEVAGPEITYTQSLGNEVNVSKTIRAPFYNNVYQPFSTAITQQLVPSDRFKENQLVREDPNNDVNRNVKQMQPFSLMPSTIYNENQKDTIGTELVSQPAQTLNVSVSQMSTVPINVSLIDERDFSIPNKHIFEENKLVQTDLISTPELDFTKISPNKDFVHPMPQMNVLQGNLSQVSIVKNEVISESQILNESYNNNLDSLSSMALTTQSLPVSQLSKGNERPEPLISPEINIGYNKTMSIGTGSNNESIFQIQPTGLSFSKQNTSQIASPAFVIYQPQSTINKDEPKLNNTLSNVLQGVTNIEQVIELPSQPQEYLPEYVQLIDNSENMRTKNAISTPAYYPEYRNKIIKTSVNDNIFGNEYQTSKIPYYNIFNPFNSRGSNQQLPSYDQNSSLKNKNIFGTTSNDRNEPQMPQFTPQLNNKNLLPSDTLNGSQDVRRINSEAEKSLGSPDSKNTNSSSTYKGGVPEYEFKKSNQFNRQTNDTVKTKLSDSNDPKKQYLPSVQDLNDDLLNKITIINQNASPKLDININIPNAESADKNIPIEITITETESTSPNIQIEHYANESICCLNSTQKCEDSTTNVDVLIPCLIDNANATRIKYNCTNSTDKSSNYKQIMPNVNLEHFSSYLADAILSAVQSFLIQPTGSRTNNFVPENYEFDNVDQYNSSCDCSKILNIKESSTQLQNCEKEMRPGILDSNEVRNDTPLVSNKKNTTTNEKCTILNSISSSAFSTNNSNKTESIQSTKDSCTCPNRITPVAPEIDDKLYIKKLNTDDVVLQTADRNYESSNLSNNTNQVLKSKYEKPSKTNNTEDKLSNQTPKILLPFYYYPDTTPNETNQRSEPKSVSKPIIPVEEDEKNVVMSLENDGSTTETTTENDLQLKRTCGPKPCLSKITVNILPIMENKNNHDIVVFL